MPEALLLCFLGLLAIAATSHRLRSASGATTARRRLGMRLLAGLLLTIALVRTGGDVDGERVVRFLAALTLAGAVLVLMLSGRQELLLHPIRRLFGKS